MVRLSPLFVVLTTLSLGCASNSTHPGLSNKWRLAVDGSAGAAGNIRLALDNAGGRISRVSIKIPSGTSENDIARRVRDELRLALPGSAYEVEVDDGEDVLVKKLADTQDFSMAVRRNTVKGVELKLSTE
jgi:hypothetical protein